MVVRTRVSEVEFLALPSSATPVELVDGEVIMSPSPSLWHQEALGRLVHALRNWADAQPSVPTVAHAPLDVRFGENRILQPDAMVFLEPLPPGSPTPISRIPDLCVELVSSDRVYDRVTKRYLYGDAGVKELWLVDPAGVVEVWAGPRLHRGLSLEAGPLRSELLPGFELEVGRLLPE